MENLCRICLCSPNLLIPIFDDTQLSDRIRIISSVVIKEDDGFPDGICLDCITKVDLCYNFRLALISSDIELKRRTTNNVTKIDEEPLLEKCEMIQRKQTESDLKQSDDGDKLQEVAMEIVTTAEKPDKVQTSLLAKEEKSKVNRKIQHKCNVCEKVLNNSELLRQHKCKKPNLKICEVCGKVVSYRSSMYQYHLEKYHEGPPTTSCSVCLEKFVNKENLKKHEEVHKRNRKCKVCNQELPTVKALKEHKRQEHNYKCELCPTIFLWKHLLQKHLIQKHRKT